VPSSALPLARLDLPLLTPRLELRLPQMRDVADLVRLLGDRRVSRPVPLPHPYTSRHGRSFVHRARSAYRSGEGLYFAIVRRDDRSLVGGIGLDQYNANDRRAHIGYWLGRPYWGLGYASEAAASVCSVAFEKFRIHRIETGALASNRRSSAVLMRLGFRLEGRARDRSRIQRQWEDDLLYGLLRSEWRRLELRKELPPARTGEKAPRRRP
jgi:RimJ/RimL family protein N-acetyltransferase